MRQEQQLAAPGPTPTVPARPGKQPDAMNEDFGSRGKTLPFARPLRAGRGGNPGAEDAMAEDWEAMLDLIRQQPDVNISKTVQLHRQVAAGHYRVNASRLADRLLQFESRFEDSIQGPGSQESGGRNS